MQVLWRDDSSSPWHSLGADKTLVLFENGKFFVRALVDHFSQGCLAKNIQPGSPYHEEVVSGFWGSPKKGQLEFVNATSRPLIFLVMPTSVSNTALHSFDAGVSVAEGGAHISMQKAVNQSVLLEAINPQVLQVGPRSAGVSDGGPRAGERCPYATCSLSKWTGREARVALITVDGNLVSVWNSRIIKQRTRVIVLPGQFVQGMLPLLGVHGTDGLVGGVESCVKIAVSVVGKHLGWNTLQSAPFSTIKSSAPTARYGD